MQRKGMQSPLWNDKEVDITFTKKAEEFIRKQTQEKPKTPFFLYLAPASPHFPCDIRPDFVKGRSDAGDRGDMVVLFDWIVGQIMDVLDKMKITDNTLLIVSSDNGAVDSCYNGEDYGHKANGRWRGQKADIWEGGHREPLIIKWPDKIESKTVCNKTICLSDFIATCSDILDVGLPEEVGEDSISFLPSLLNQNTDDLGREEVIHHSAFGHYSIRKGKWKLIDKLGSGGFTKPKHVSESNKGQLYDVEEDPSEKNNLWVKYT